MTTNGRYRLAVLSRIVAGFGGGYLVTWLAVGLLSLCLPGSRASAVLFATMPAFFIYALIVMALFRARSVLRAWIWIAGVSTLLGGLILLISGDGLR